MAFWNKKKVPNQLGIIAYIPLITQPDTTKVPIRILPTKITLSKAPINGVVHNDIAMLELHFKFVHHESLVNRRIFDGGVGQQVIWVAKKVNKDSYIGHMWCRENVSPFSVGYLRQLQEAGNYNGAGNVPLLNYIFGDGHQISPTIEIDLS